MMIYVISVNGKFDRINGAERPSEYRTWPLTKRRVRRIRRELGKGQHIYTYRVRHFGGKEV